MVAWLRVGAFQRGLFVCVCFEKYLSLITKKAFQFFLNASVVYREQKWLEISAI
jgi:hypothetical protein